MKPSIFASSPGPISTSRLRAALGVVYPIFMLVGANGAAIYLASAGASELWLGAVVIGAVAASFTVESLIPYEPRWNDSHATRDARRDAIHVAVNEGMTIASVAALPMLSGHLLARDVWPHDWPFVLQVLAAIMVFDAGVTLTHFASHKIGWLWRFHAVHHSVKRFYGFNGLMKHPVHQAIEMTVGVTPLLLTGVPVRVVSALAACTAIQLLMQHSNADYRAGFLGRLLALNQGHRFHHLPWSGVGDVNFGLFTNLWDYLLGTRSFDASKRFTSEDLGIGEEPNFPREYGAQLLAPFRKIGSER